jgi:excisionase family DNA binding protein
MMLKKSFGQLEIIPQTQEEKYLIAAFLECGERYETRLVDSGIQIHTNPSSKYLSVKQCAQMLEFNVESLRRKCRRGEIPYRKVGNRILFIKREIENWIESKDKAFDSDSRAKKILNEIMSG